MDKTDSLWLGQWQGEILIVRKHLPLPVYSNKSTLVATFLDYILAVKYCLEMQKYAAIRLDVL